MGSSLSSTRRWKPPTCSMKWKLACSSSQKRGGCKRALCAKAGALAGDRGRAGHLGRATGAGQAHARLGALGRTPPGRQLGARGRGREQCGGGKPPGCVAHTDGQASDRGHARPGWSGNVSMSSCRCSPTCGRTWSSAMTGRTFPGPTTTWSAAFVDSRRATAASVAARTGMPICCATGARRPTTSGGSRMRPGDNNSSRSPPGSIILAGANCVARPPSPSTSNSRAFASVTSARLCSLPSRSAGLPLLPRILCPDGKKSAEEACQPSTHHLDEFVEPVQAPAGPVMVPLSVPEVRRLFWYLVGITPLAPLHRLAWSMWRRSHQALAKLCHYKRRLAHYLQL